MRIKEAAQATGLTVQAIRYFEQEGLVPPPLRSDNGYRSYGPAQVERLHVIANCRALEMSHSEIRALLALCDAPQLNCDEASTVVRAHIVHVENRIAALRALLKRLHTLYKLCNEPGPVAGCDLLHHLAVVQPTRAARQAGAGAASHL